MKHDVVIATMYRENPENCEVRIANSVFHDLSFRQGQFRGEILLYYRKDFSQTAARNDSTHQIRELLNLISSQFALALHHS